MKSIVQAMTGQVSMIEITPVFTKYKKIGNWLIITSLITITIYILQAEYQPMIFADYPGGQVYLTKSVISGILVLIGSFLIRYSKLNLFEDYEWWPSLMFACIFLSSIAIGLASLLFSREDTLPLSDYLFFDSLFPLIASLVGSITASGLHKLIFKTIYK